MASTNVINLRERVEWMAPPAGDNVAADANAVYDYSAIELHTMRNVTPHALVFNAGTAEEMRLEPSPSLRLVFADSRPNTTVRIVTRKIDACGGALLDVSRYPSITSFCAEAARYRLPKETIKEMMRGREWIVMPQDAPHYVGHTYDVNYSHNGVWTAHGLFVSVKDADGVRTGAQELHVERMERHYRHRYE